MYIHIYMYICNDDDIFTRFGSFVCLCRRNDSHTKSKFIHYFYTFPSDSYVCVCVRVRFFFGLKHFFLCSLFVSILLLLGFYLFWPFISIKLGKTSNLLQFVSPSTKQIYSSG